MTQSAFLSTIILAVFLIACSVSAEGPSKAADATFVVRCFDVGDRVLTGRPGVLSVRPGWSGVHEVNRVEYDPEIVSLKQLETWLTQADTYIKTMELSTGVPSEKETSP